MESNKDKVVWELADDECNEIQNLFEKKISLENLIKIIDLNNKELYDKVIKDYGKALREFQAWWDINSKEHNWEGANWYVNFQKKQVLCKE